VNTNDKLITEGDVDNKNPLTYLIKFNYKDFAFKQLAAGLWGENILSLCQPNSISQLKATHQTLDQQIL
jgi:hypothetical protein